MEIIEKFVQNGKINEKTFCRFCLSITNAGNFRVIEETITQVLDVLLLKLSVQEQDKSVICNACSTKLAAAFEFKASCMDTEDCIFPYVNSESEAPVDLREIYLRERGKVHLIDILEDERICRLCMEVLTCEFTSVEEIDVDMLCMYIPEINFNSTKESVICTACVTLLGTHTSFLKNCLDIEKKIEAAETLPCVKREDVDIKWEFDDVSSTQHHSFKNKLLDSPKGSVPADTKPAIKLQTETYQSVACGWSKQQNSLQFKRYKCDKCEYKAYRKDNLIRHQLTHKSDSELKLYACELCTFKTKRKDSLGLHRLARHTNKDKTPKFKCDTCDYNTKKESYLVRHKLQHKDLAPVKLYKCDKCLYMTDKRRYFREHLERHSTNRKLYKCDSCNFRTFSKSYFSVHNRIHKCPSLLPTYKCEDCDFRTKYKKNFTSHQWTQHQNPSGAQSYECDIRMYPCDTCDFQTKDKAHLKVHRLEHRNSSEIAKFHCGTCSYRCDTRASLICHQVTHKEIHEEPAYKCDKCDFGTNRKFSLQRHELTHMKSEEIEKFECDKCDFKTNYKCCLPRHFVRHHTGLRKRN